MTSFLDKSFNPKSLLWGTFQNLIYLQEVNDIIQQEFVLATPLTAHNQQLKQQIDSVQESVFLHIRLGDYLAHPEYVRLGATYYNRALNIIKEKIKNPHIFIFSNGIEWCEKHLIRLIDFSGCKVSFVKGNDEGNAIQEMELMRSCKHAIIANSTFSWWAAYLIANPSKIVIMPKFFFNDPLLAPHTEALIPKDWIVLDHIWGEAHAPNV